MMKCIGRLYAIIYVLLFLLFVSIAVYAKSDEDEDDDDDDATEEDADDDPDENKKEMEEDEEEEKSADDASADDEDENADRLIRRLWMLHGLCAAMAWAILVPLAVASSLLRHLLERNCLISWFPIHRFLNGTAIVLTVVAIGLAVIAYGNDDDDDPHFVDEPHHFVGLLIGIGSVLQGLNGFLRPHLPQPHSHAAPVVVLPAEKEESSSEVNDDSDNHHNPAPETVDNDNNAVDSSPHHHHHHHHPANKKQQDTQRSTIRIMWEYLHRTLGVSLLVASWWQIQSGLDLFVDEFEDDDDDDSATRRPSSQRDLRPIFFAVIGGLTGMVLLLFVCQSTMIKAPRRA
jgi:hypothetical protein